MIEVLGDTGPERKPFFVTLPGRGLIRVGGPDRHAFLQALVSNDLDLLRVQDSLYACLLTPQGKYLFDFIIFKEDDRLVLDCEGGARLQALFKKLSLYKLRMKVDMEALDSHPVYAIYHMSFGETYQDPRHPAMGSRSLEKPEGIEEKPFAAWDEHRIRLGIPDGSRDMIPEQSTLIECNLDRLNGISFEKGCYVGQELTARMHHRGLAKKHLYAVEWPDEAPVPGTDIGIGGHAAGQARSACGRTGLALLKDETVRDASILPFALIRQD